MSDKSFTTSESADVKSIQEDNLREIRAAIFRRYPQASEQDVDGALLDATESFAERDQIERRIEEILGNPHE